jgi:threonine dehydrogenase-like Zn-dependent dehydrogenase
MICSTPAAQCWPLPDHLDDVAGSLTEPLACAIRAVALSHVRPGDPLVILGAGPIGLCCVAAARAAGVEQIMVSDIAAQRLAVAEQCGGVAAVIDAVGTDATRAQAIAGVVPGGRVVFIGLHAEASPLAANYLIRQEITITGSFTYTMDEFKQALDLLSQGRVRPSNDWLEERPLDAGPDAFEELVDGRAATSKIVLRVA